MAHLVYEIRSRPDFLPFLMGEELFSDAQPIREKTVVVRVPQGTLLKSGLLNRADVEPVQDTVDGYDRYTWQIKDLPAARPEGMAQPAADHAVVQGKDATV